MQKFKSPKYIMSESKWSSIKILFISIILMLSIFIPNINSSAAEDNYARLSKKQFYIYGCRIPYLLENGEDYYVKLEYLLDLGHMDDFYDKENVFYLSMQDAKQEKWYNLDWKSVYKPGDRIGEIKRNKEITIYEDYWEKTEVNMEVYNIKQIPYIKIRDFDFENHPLNYDEEAEAFYIGKLPTGELKRDTIYEFLVKAKGKAKTERDILQNVHNYQILFMSYNYDYSTVNTSLRMLKNQSSALNVLKGKKGICFMYAELYKEACDRLMIPCNLVTGQAGGDSHEWNQVYVDGKWSYVDVTWDDPIGNKYKKVNDIRQKYFLIDAKALKSSHYWQGEGSDYPEFSKSWSKIDRNNIKTTEEFRKAAAYAAYKADGEEKKYIFKITASKPYSVDSGIAFLYHYGGWYSFSRTRSKDGKTITIIFNNY
ncbi:transglutaminase-like putative cysteine protease [Anaerotaenia torta]|uniref:transglutaminase domain-containing protein n=1 Tax=Anaerotaenia torta TaxID=433293 RepID=UPI003D1AEC0B